MYIFYTSVLCTCFACMELILSRISLEMYFSMTTFKAVCKIFMGVWVCWLCVHVFHWKNVWRRRSLNLTLIYTDWTARKYAAFDTVHWFIPLTGAKLLRNDCLFIDTIQNVKTKTNETYKALCWEKENVFGYWYVLALYKRKYSYFWLC